MGAPPPDENTWSTPTDRPYLVRMRPRFLRASGTMAGDRHAATTRLRDALDQAGAALTDVHFFSGVHTSFSFEIQEKALPTLHAALVAAGVRLRPEGDAAFAVGPRLAEEATVVGVLAISFADGDGDLTHEIPAVPG